MEFKANKLRIDINNQLQEDIRTDKIHDNDKHYKINNNLSTNKNDEKEKRKNKKRYIVVDGYKVLEKSISVEAQNEVFLYDENGKNIKGNKIDIKK